MAETTGVKACCCARRLVEAGSTIVTCHFGGWDSHWNTSRTMKLLPGDQAVLAC
ncbi:MAG: hypothetical protein R3B90_14470 [Planctomycetaceae bacterium]